MKKYTIEDLKKKEIIKHFAKYNSINERDICKIIAVRLRNKADKCKRRSQSYLDWDINAYFYRERSHTLHKKAEKLFAYALTLPMRVPTVKRNTRPIEDCTYGKGSQCLHRETFLGECSKKNCPFYTSAGVFRWAVNVF